jgi:CheY-like chemotaxis protein
MTDVFEGLRVRLRWLRRLLTRPSVLEADDSFRAALTEGMHVGLRWGGASILVGVVAHVALSVALRGERVRWTYSAAGSDEVAVLYHAFVFALGAGLLALSSTRCSLRLGRLAGAAAALGAATASMHDDLAHGTSVAVEYVFMVYTLSIVMVPFRPGQALGLGGGLVGLYFALTEAGLLLPPGATAGAAVGRTVPGLLMAVLLGTAASAVLYAIRRAQHRRRPAAPTGADGANDEAAPSDLDGGPDAPIAAPPSSRGDGAPEPPEAPATDEDAPGDRATVLVVEDDADMRRYVGQLLRPRYRVLEAEHGREGLERTRAALPDLVVTDVMMPGLDGLQLVEHLRRAPRTEHIPVVILTARAETEDRVEGLSGGAEAYVTKPFRAAVLRAQVRSLIEAQRALRAHLQSRAPEADAAGPASFEARVRTAVARRLSDADLSVEALAEDLGYTRRTLTRKVKDAFDQPPSALIRRMRLDRGAELLREEAGTVSEIAYAVGFNSLSYFSRRFKKHFGTSPSAYRADHAPDADGQ